MALRNSIFRRAKFKLFLPRLYNNIFILLPSILYYQINTPEKKGPVMYFFDNLLE
ncbi:MAG: hypothetical protein ACI90V_005445 [Bacillariaceae sp.]|jgi:hypothetical protein